MANQSGACWAGELELVGQHGAVVVWARSAPLGFEIGEQALVLAAISALRAREHRADHDLLTGLINRRALAQRLSASLERAPEREPGSCALSLGRPRAGLALRAPAPGQ